MQFSDIKGMGKSRIQKLKEAGFNEPLDLLLHFPYAYVDLAAPVDFSALRDGDTLTVCGTVANEPKTQFLRKGLRLCKAVLSTPHGQVEAAWFNQKYIAAALPHGKTVYVTGKVKKFRNKITITAPTILHPNGKTVVPLYRRIAGVPQSVVDEAIDLLLARTEVRGYIPDGVRARRGLPSLGNAFSRVHRPATLAEAQGAAYALSVEKLSYTLAMYRIVKDAHVRGKKRMHAVPPEKLQAATDSLPFALTKGQQTALRSVLTAMRGDTSMNMLLQGDVGCGKTVVALLCMYYAYLCGHQSVLMVPTEVLAMQHYRTAIRLIEPLGAKAVLLTGSLRKEDRENVLFAVRTHTADIIIGTHALLSEDVVFPDVSLVITDEQQRFGVGQRGALENKAAGADSLVMTATPIPRTLALCLYGELEQVCIDTLPSGRPEIVTSIVPPHKVEDMYKYIAARAALKEQTYVVCPRIDADDEENLISATGMFSLLRQKFPNMSVGLLHGRMRESEKADTMAAFARGDIAVLVTTTVIEVGIDVPAAVHIVLCNAERYGLSQLHQLRGRVGRGSVKSYCFLPVDGQVPDRLRYFCSCCDGFLLSEYDFAARGAGDFIGTRQHGDRDDLPVKIDAALIEEAKAVAEDMVCDTDVRERLREGLTDGAERYVRSVTMN